MALIVKIGANLKDYDKQMKKLTGDVNRVGDKLKSAGKNLTTGLTLPLVALGGVAVKVGMDFDKQMSKVQAISGATGDNFDSLRKQAQDLGATTAFTATQAAEGMEYLALAGWKTNDILSAMPGMLNLAAAGALDLGTAADITSDVMSAFGISADKAGHAADVFAYAQANANTNVSQMGEAMTYLAPVANALGWQFEESAAAVMKLADSGVKGSMAGQAFATSLGRLAKPTKAMNKEMKRLGMEFFDAKGNMKSLPEVMAEIEKGTEGMTKQQKSSTLSTLFGAQAYKHWAILLESGSETLQDYTDKLKNADGTAENMANTMLDNFAGALVMLKSALEGLAIQFSDIMTGPLRAFAESITNLVGKFAALDESTKIIIVVIAALLAAIGPILLALGIGIVLFGQITAALTVLGISFIALVAPIALAVAAIIGIVAAFVLFGDEIKAFWNKHFKPIIDQMISIVVQSLKPSFDQAFKMLSKIVSDSFGIMKRVYHEILEPLFKLIVWYIQNILLPAWKVIFTALGSVLSDAFRGMGQVWEKVLKPVLNGIISFINGVFTGNWSKAWQGLVDIFKGIFNGIILAAKAPINAVISMVNGLIKGLNKLSFPDWVPGLGGKGINIPTIPMLAKGGNVTGKGKAIVGEAGPELLEKSGSSVKVTPLSSREKAQGITGALNANKGGIYEFNISIPLDGRELVRQTIVYTEEELEFRKHRRNLFR
ncbi:phage tail tape measure protein [Sutcliffiella halmapala]|uniref:phage tail tape measure protein n=1 Tax=Sutcliffiella halmapala TaxID=79882 RepID=UPI0009958725|nr:phage tail tape measure protein [Sutcliffiella halmapala]